ncbi:MAG: 50S ribosomal protein L28 [Candidatus Brocadiia bacterium]
MSHKCDICGKGPGNGNKVQSRGRAKREGGVGIKQTGRSKRKFKPNIQRVWAMVDGAKKHIHACTKCIKSGRVKKPPR